jgi:hypothetical protein
MDEHVEWETRQAGGWREFRAARGRALDRLAREAAVARLELAWSTPAHEGSAERTAREVERFPFRQGWLVDGG